MDVFTSIPNPCCDLYVYYGVLKFHPLSTLRPPASSELDISIHNDNIASRLIIRHLHSQDDASGHALTPARGTSGPGTLGSCCIPQICSHGSKTGPALSMLHRTIALNDTLQPFRCLLLAFTVSAEHKQHAHHVLDHRLLDGPHLFRWPGR
eukprot:2293752-Pleurochrysis_carterae.AAC.1